MKLNLINAVVGITLVTLTAGCGTEKKDTRSSSSTSFHGSYELGCHEAAPSIYQKAHHTFSDGDFARIRDFYSDPQCKDLVFQRVETGKYQVEENPEPSTYHLKMDVEKCIVKCSNPSKLNSPLWTQYKFHQWGEKVDEVTYDLTGKDPGAIKFPRMHSPLYETLKLDGDLLFLGMGTDFLKTDKTRQRKLEVKREKAFRRI